MSYVCKEDKSDESYQELITITVDRVALTAKRENKLTNRARNSYSEHLRTYDSCAILSIAQKFKVEIFIIFEGKFMKNLFTNFTSSNASKWALLLLTFSLSANAQVIECQPIERRYYEGDRVTIIDCKKEIDKCHKLKVDVAKCEKSSLSYICKVDMTDEQWDQMITTTVNRVDLTAFTDNLLKKKYADRYSKHYHTYDSCAILNVTPKL